MFMDHTCGNPTRELIKAKAKELFNQRGYACVSLRDIAAACHISVGNLNYHFHRKELLIMEVQRGIYDEFYGLLESTAQTVADIVHKFRLIDRNQREYPYYFKNMLELCRSYEVIRTNQVYFREKLFTYYLQSFMHLAGKGLFLEGTSQNQFYSLAYSIVFQHTLWYESDAPTYDLFFREINYVWHLCNLLRPYLTTTGLAELEQALSAQTASPDPGR
ncbi:MAG: TetR/AcrR family transcriptional regulator [Gracilibacteraceae bacterium]|jgi:AcrR family transcriptional regulator|nr:TetR/AcrR family transcriptional regulator [Gracilibacteraceae bacterium]